MMAFLECGGEGGCEVEERWKRQKEIKQVDQSRSG